MNVIMEKAIFNQIIFNTVLVKNLRGVKNSLDMENIVLFVRSGTLGVLIKIILNIASKNYFQKLQNCLMILKNAITLMITLISGNMIMNIR